MWYRGLPRRVAPRCSYPMQHDSGWVPLNGSRRTRSRSCPLRRVRQVPKKAVVETRHYGPRSHVELRSWCALDTRKRLGDAMMGHLLQCRASRACGPRTTWLASPSHRPPIAHRDALYGWLVDTSRVDSCRPGAPCSSVFKGAGWVRPRTAPGGRSAAPLQHTTLSQYASNSRLLRPLG